MKKNDFDVIVIGAGHAGCEAALVNARMGLRTLMITTKLDHIAYMSCNPAIGGLAKGHIVREMDALGGEMGVNTDKSTIQFKRLNTKKGPAVRASRSQCDKELYSTSMKDVIFTTPNLSTLEGEVKHLIIEGHECCGVVVEKEGAASSEIRAAATIVTTGTFMNGMMHVGLEQKSGGRAGDKASVGLSGHLKELGFKITRLKTGTPARLHKRSIDWSKTTPQSGDEVFFPFSRKTKGLALPQVRCFLSYTNEQTHEIIRKNLDKSPLFCGVIEGIGPRYCPSIEDKVTRFADKDRHQTFLEPEGLTSDLIYVQGMSTSLPVDVQYAFLKTIPGLENVEIVRPGYAIEYDFIHPTQLRRTLETKTLRSLYLAGQVNGTSGYEEAAGQGFWAGLNAALKILDRGEFVLGRNEAYLGVLIDDLVTKGTEEPYRMFTSRAEYRLLLREDNTDERLIQKSFALGLLTQGEMDDYNKLQAEINVVRHKMQSVMVNPHREAQAKLASLGSAPLLKPARLEDLLRRSEISFNDLRLFEESCLASPAAAEKIEIAVKYAGYIKRQNELVIQTSRLDSLRIPRLLDYSTIVGFSNEEREKLEKIQPETVGQANRISGVNPSAIQALLVHLKGREKLKNLSLG